MKRNKNQVDAGAPRWTYVVGSLVAAGTLAWAVLKDTALNNPPPQKEPVMVNGSTSAAQDTTSTSTTQSAKAGQNGLAINASGAAQVHIHNP